MNKTEQAYADRLEILRRAGEVLSFRFEAIKLRLAKNTFYTPDFLVVTPSQIEFHEVKGFWQDDARVKIKVAADQYPEFAFIAVQKSKDGWKVEEF
jgi:hypothetical protein